MATPRSDSPEEPAVQTGCAESSRKRPAQPDSVQSSKKPAVQHDSAESSKKPLRPQTGRSVTSATFIQVSFGQSPPPIESESPTPADFTDDDGDGGYGSSESVATESIVSSIRDYLYENGRRYHRYSEGSYTLPNDEKEMERLELVHHLNLLVLRGALCATPIGDQPIKVLDCGTGTGIWALDFGEVHPNADVVGVDLSPIQPTWVYPNVRFEVDDLEREWTYPKDHFDFIYSRHIGQSIKDWDRYLKQMFDHCAPNGRIEVIEHAMEVKAEDDSYSDDCDLAKYIKRYAEATHAAGMRFVKPETIEAAAREAGFVDIEVHTIKIPWGAWPKNRDMKNIGATFAAVLSTGGFEAFALQIMTRYLGMKPDEIASMSQAALKDVMSRKIHSYQEQWYILARKPEAPATPTLDATVDIQVYHHSDSE